jgi:hypothetical protein
MQHSKSDDEKDKGAKAEGQKSRSFKQLVKRCVQFLWLDSVRQLRRFRTWVEIAALIGAFVYAAIAYQQWQAQQRTMEIDERAWLKVESAFPREELIKETLAVFAHVKLTDTGKTFGKKIEADYVIL